MPKLRVLSGKDVVALLGTFGFRVASQKGSHVKLQRTKSDGGTQTLVIPNHRELDKGTLRAIYNQLLRFVSEEGVRKHFYE